MIIAPRQNSAGDKQTSVVLGIIVACWTSFVVLKPAFLGLSGEEHIFGNLAVTSDGLDWIVQGYALYEQVDQVWPQLRNIGFVLVSAIGAASGAPSVVIGLSLSIGLIFQLFFVYRISRLVTDGYYSKLLVIATFSSLPFHFFSNYVLADTIAIGLMMASVYFGLKNHLEANHRHWAAAVTFALLATLFQNYGWGPILVIFSLGLFRRFRRYTKTLTQTLILITGIALQQLITYNWVHFIEHKAQPTQFGLLSVSFDMFDFYLGIYSSIYTPPIIGFLISFALFSLFGNKLPRRDAGYWVIFLLGAIGVSFTLLVFFYQWRESRFSYIGSTFLVLAITLVLVKLADNCKEPVYGLFLLPFIGIVFAGWFLLTPSNEWRPTLQELDYGSHWSIRQTYSNTTPTTWIFEATNDFCSEGGLLPTREELREEYGLSNYQSNIGRFAIANCFFSK